MCGIFAYLNHLTPKTRKEILDVLIKVRGELPFAILVSIFSSLQGLQRLEYRGYDSAGVISIIFV